MPGVYVGVKDDTVQNNKSGDPETTKSDQSTPKRTPKRGRKNSLETGEITVLKKV